MFLASLPWYDLKEIRPATDRLWRQYSGILHDLGLREVPTRLDRRNAYEKQWRSRRLLFSQACGYDVLFGFRQKLRPIATPRYSAKGCRGHEYSSLILVREKSRVDAVEELRGSRCVINTPTSHSGMNILRSLVAPLHTEGRFFSEVSWSGTHRKSLARLQKGHADVAAVDSVTFELLNRCRPDALRGIRVLSRTRHVPAPPYVTGAGTSPATLRLLRRALIEVMMDRELAGLREELMLEGVDIVPLRDYKPIADLERSARKSGYREIVPSK